MKTIGWAIAFFAVIIGDGITRYFEPDHSTFYRGHEFTGIVGAVCLIAMIITSIIS